MSSLVRLVFVVSAVALLGAVGLAEDEGKPGLRLELALPKAAYLVDEPLYVTVTVTNTATSEAEVWDMSVDPSTSGIVFEITEPDGTTYDWQPPYILDWSATPRQAIHLDPGEPYSKSFDLTYTLKRGARKRVTLLSTPGRYAVQVRGMAYRASNKVTLTVSQPTGRDAQAHEILVQGQLGAQLEARFWDLGEKLRTVLDEYPGSAYAVYARFHLAQTLERTANWRIWDGDSRQKLREAARLYQNVYAQAGDTPFGRAGLRMSGRALAKLRNFADAVESLQAAFEAPNSTTHERVEAVYWLQTTEVRGQYAFPVELPMEEVARAFGFKVETDEKTRRAYVTSPKVKLGLRPNSAEFTIDGKEHSGFYMEGPLGHYRLSVPVIVALLRAHYRTEAFDYIANVDDSVYAW